MNVAEETTGKAGAVNRAGGPRRGRPSRQRWSGELEVGRGGLPALHRSVVDHLLAVVQPLQAGGLHGSDVNEHVLAAVLRHDEAVALGGIEPLYGAGGHGRLLLVLSRARAGLGVG